MTDQITDESKDAIVKAKEAAEAVEVSRTRQMQDMLDKSDARNVKTLSSVLKNVFGEHEKSGRFVDVSQLGLICFQIDELFKRVENIDGNLRWLVRLIIGAIVTGCAGLIFFIIQNLIANYWK